VLKGNAERQLGHIVRARCVVVVVARCHHRDTAGAPTTQVFEGVMSAVRSTASCNSYWDANEMERLTNLKSYKMQEAQT
jgi:hypothetical protein